MTRPVNIYSLSRIHNESHFNAVDKILSQKNALPHVQFHEIESLRFLADHFLQHGVTVGEMDNFFFGYVIPQIGKEFDLLRFTDTSCLNIELKSTEIPDGQIKQQLLKNRHYLNHLGISLQLYTVVTSPLICYNLSEDGELIKVRFAEIIQLVKQTASACDTDIDSKFRVSQYLVSPFNTPERFIQGEYFLTQAQEDIKKKLLRSIEEANSGAFFHLTGKPGTGKTLLLYDIAKELSGKGKTSVVHCG